jgi:hypothetical protein
MSTSESTIVGPIDVSTPLTGLPIGRSIKFIGTRYTLSSTAKLRQTATLRNPQGKRLNIYSATDGACMIENSTTADSPKDNVLEYTTTATTFTIGQAGRFASATGAGTGTPAYPAVCLRIQCMETSGNCGTQVSLSGYRGLLVTVTPAASSSSANATSAAISSVLSILFCLAMVALVVRCMRARQLRQQQEMQAQVTGYPAGGYPPGAYPAGGYPGNPYQQQPYPVQPPMYAPQQPLPKAVYMEQQQQQPQMVYPGAAYPQQAYYPQPMYYPQQNMQMQQNRGGMGTGAAVGMGVLGGLVVGNMMSDGGREWGGSSSARSPP